MPRILPRPNRCRESGRQATVTFFQREGGGRTAAILVSLLATAKAAGVNVHDYFRDVLTRIATCSDVKQLTPHGWQQHFEPEVSRRRQALLEQLVGQR